MTSSRSSVRVNRAKATIAPPRAREPESPMKICAFETFHQRKPAREPIKDAAISASEPGSRTS